MSNITVNTSALAGLAPLYHKYKGQFEPQTAHLEISPESNRATFDYSGEIGNAIPFSVYHGRDLRLDVSPFADGRELTKLATDEAFVSLLDRVVAGHSVEWDGNNHIGKLDDDASAAIEEMESMLSRVDTVEVWDADEWLNGELYDDGGTPLSKLQIAQLTDDRITELARDCDLIATSENQVINGLEDAIERMRDEAREELED